MLIKEREGLIVRVPRLAILSYHRPRNSGSHTGN